MGSFGCPVGGARRSMRSPLGFFGALVGPCWVLVDQIRGSLENTIVFLNISKGAWGSLARPLGILGEPWGAIGGLWRVQGEAPWRS